MTPLGWLGRKTSTQQHQFLPRREPNYITIMYIMNTQVAWQYSRLSLARIPRNSLTHFEISVSRNIRIAEVRKTINRTITFNKWICNLIPEVRDILKILWKRGEIAPRILCYLFFDFHVKIGTRISLRDKPLFEISEVEITIINYFNIGDDNQLSYQIVSAFMGHFLADCYALQRCSGWSDPFQPRNDQHVLNAS